MWGRRMCAAEDVPKAAPNADDVPHPTAAGRPGDVGHKHLGQSISEVSLANLPLLRRGGQAKVQSSETGCSQLQNRGHLN